VNKKNKKNTKKITTEIFEVIFFTRVDLMGNISISDIFFKQCAY
jgi:hypothetical protein